MNLNALRDTLTQIKAVRPIGRAARAEGCVCHAMGLVLREGGELQLLLLVHDPELQERFELEGPRRPREPETNRLLLRGDPDAAPALSLCGAVETITIGDQRFSAGGSQSGFCRGGGWEQAALFSLFTRFLLEGWEPVEVGGADMSVLSLTTLCLDGTYEAIPELDLSAPIRLSMRKGSARHLVERPVALAVGGEYPEKLFFTDSRTGEVRWAQINRVYLCDAWAEMERLFADPRMRAHASAEVLAREKTNFEARFADDCPRGMCYPAVEYECEEGISLQFHASRWLEEAPARRNSGMAFLVKADQPVGRLGLPLKTAVLQTPVPADTERIEAELFSCYDKGKDIII